MPETLEVETNERETAYQQGSTTAPKQPSVTTFKEIVTRHCHAWGVTSVDNLCEDQTRSLIVELANHFS